MKSDITVFELSDSLNPGPLSVDSELIDRKAKGQGVQPGGQPTIIGILKRNLISKFNVSNSFFKI